MNNCMSCGGPAEFEGWAFPSGGSFPVVGCNDCLTQLDTDLGGGAISVTLIKDE